MDKQKQIEEMAKVIEEAMAKARRTLGGHNNIAMFYATMLVNAGYRKIAEGGVIEKNKAYKYMRGEIPKNAVVILDEEMEEFAEKLAKSPQMQKVMSHLIKEWRKETAEKFAERLKAELNEWLEDNEDLNGKIDFGIASIELIGVKSLDGEVIAESLIDEIAKEIIIKQ